MSAGSIHQYFILRVLLFLCMVYNPLIFLLPTIKFIFLSQYFYVITVRRWDSWPILYVITVQVRRLLENQICKIQPYRIISKQCNWGETILWPQKRRAALLMLDIQIVCLSWYWTSVEINGHNSFSEEFNSLLATLAKLKEILQQFQ